VDIDALGAMASTGMGTAEAMGNERGKGNYNQMMVDAGEGTDSPLALSKGRN